MLRAHQLCSLSSHRPAHLRESAREQRKQELRRRAALRCRMQLCVEFCFPPHFYQSKMTIFAPHFTKKSPPESVRRVRQANRSRSRKKWTASHRASSNRAWEGVGEGRPRETALKSRTPINKRWEIWIFVVVVSTCTFERSAAAGKRGLLLVVGKLSLVPRLMVRVPEQSQTRTRLLLNAPSSRSHPRSC